MEEKAREELTDQNIQTGVDPAPPPPANQIWYTSFPKGRYRAGACPGCILCRDDFVETWSRKGATGAGICLPEVHRNAKEEVPQ